MPTIVFDDFSDGLWIPAEVSPTTEQPDFALPPGGLLAADNVEFLPNGAVRGRRGSSKFNAVARPGPIVALERFYSAPDLTTRMSGSGSTTGLNTNEGAVAWQNRPGAIVPNDGSIASAILSSQETYGLAIYPRFGVTNPIPPDASIERIEVRIFRRVGFDSGFFTGDVVDAAVTLRLGSLASPSVTSADKANTVDLWPSEAFETAIYGNVLDVDPLWGTAWTAEDVNDDTFRVEIRANAATNNVQARIDGVEIFIYLASSIIPRFLVAHTDGGNIVWETADGGVFTGITGGTYPEPSSKPAAVHWPQKGRLFIADGLNALKAYNGEAIVDVDTNAEIGIAPRRGPYIVLHKSRLYATEPTELHYSVYASDVDDQTTWRPTSHLNVNDDRGGIITGLASFGDTLVIFKDTAVFSFTGDPETFGFQLEEIDDRGCVAPDSIAVTPFGVVYVGRDGVYLTDGREVREVSRAIQPLFVARTTETPYPTAVAEYHQRKQQYVLKLDPTADPAYVLQRLPIQTSEGETVKLPWARWPSFPMNVATTWPGSGDSGQLYVGDRDGFVWLRDAGTTDGGAAISCTVRTREVLMNPDLVLGRAYQVRAIARMSSAMVLQLTYDHALGPQVAFAVVGAGANPAVYQELRQFIADTATLGLYVSVNTFGGNGPNYELQRILLDVTFRSRRRWQ